MTSGEWQASIGNLSGSNARNSASPTSKLGDGAPTCSSKSILLVDVNPRTRESRAKELRMRGVIVHCATSADTALTRFASSKYNLVLIDLGQDDRGAESLVHEIKTNNPRQRIAFLVGSPMYLASSLKRDGAAVQQATAPERPVAAIVPAASDFGQKIREAEAEGRL
jgi:CheY-like chemotaxis protein